MSLSLNSVNARSPKRSADRHRAQCKQGPRRLDVPAVVVGGTLNSLGVVRSLATAVAAIYVLDVSRACPAAWSRYGRFVRTRDLEGEPLVAALLELASRLECRPVLILTADQHVETVSALREHIEPHFRISLPAHEMVRTLSDKVLFQRFAEGHAFPVPRAVSLDEGDSLNRLATLTPPLVLKPADKRFERYGLAERAVRAESLHEARLAAHRMLACARRVLAQEWIDGLDSDLYFVLFSCDARGQLIGQFCGRKLLCSPPQVGSTAVCIAAPEVAEQLAIQTRRFIEVTGYRGLGSLEFKRERSTGQFLIVEPTVGRTDWQEEIATFCGINLPLLTYLAELDGERPSGKAASSSVGAPAPIAWRSSLQHRGPEDGTGTKVRAIDGFFRWTDPVPAIYHYGYERGARRLWRGRHRLFPRRHPPLPSSARAK